MFYFHNSVISQSLLTWGRLEVQSDPFHDRIEAVRRRFAASLECKLQDAYAQLPVLAGEGAQTIAAVEESYRRMHAICGIGAAVGFVGTGRAAKDVEDVLIGPFRGRRGLAADEVTRLERSLAALAATAAAELVSAGAPALAATKG